MKNDKSVFFAEVLESSLQTVRAECWDTNDVPVFGSLVVMQGAHPSSEFAPFEAREIDSSCDTVSCARTSGRTEQSVYALVYNINTSAGDGVMTPHAYGKTQEQLRQEHPEIFVFLKTQVSAAFIQVPERPVGVHTFVRRATPEEYTQVFSDPEALFVLAGLQTLIPNLDELVLAVIKNLKQTGVFSHDSLFALIRTYTQLHAHDYRRVRLFIQRVEREFS